MVEKVLKWIMQALGVALVAGFLFWLLLQGIDQHQEALDKLYAKPIELRR